MLIPTTPLVPQAAARPPVPFLLAVRSDARVRHAFGSLPQFTPKTTPQPVSAAPSTVQPPAARRAPNLQRTSAAGVRTGARQPMTHVVVSGDTLWSLARRYGTSVSTLAQMNGLSETVTLRLGQRLAVQPSAAAASSAPRVTRGESRTIVVRSGQTLSEIAETYGVSTRTLVEANGLRNAHAIRAGQRLTIPGSSGASARTTRATLPPARVQASGASRPLANAVQRGFFLWPARGVLTSRFGMRWRRHHNGIDIAARRGTAIYAARGGLVAFAGWYYGYGLTVIIDHGGGIVSLYGHASALLVRGGQAVAVGQQIARVGCTGSCTGSHVHFEIRVNGRPVNPLSYL